MALLAAVTVWMTAFPLASPSPPTAFQVGEPFPDLLLPSLAGGEARSLADFRGRKVILHVFASW